MKKLLLVLALSVLVASTGFAQESQKPVDISAPIKLPRYAADVPEGIMTPDIVQTERLGELRFFDGMPSKETVKKVSELGLL